MSARSAARDLFGTGSRRAADSDRFDRGASQQELREQEELLRLAVEATGLGIWDMELPSGRTEWSLKLRALAGISPDAAIDDDVFYNLVHKEDRDRVAAALKAAVTSKNREPYSITYRVYRLDTHEERWWSEWSRLVPDPSGNPARVVGAIEDITERKRTELERQHSEKRWRLGLAAARMVAWEYNVETGVTTMSDNSEELLGFSSADITEFLDRVHPSDRRKVASVISTPAPRTTTIEFRFRGAEGHYLWLRTTTTAVGPSDPGRIVGVSSDITARKAAEEKLLYAASHDAMTGLLNRAAIQAKLDRAIASAAKRGVEVTLLVVDIDNFKDTNDTLGHDAGDCLLKFAADVLRDRVGSKGLVARLGGDEFAVVVEGPAAPDDHARLAGGIQDALRQGFHYQGKTRRVAASLGLASFPEHASTSLDILKSADLALYAAKRSGRDRLTRFTPELLEQAQQRAAVIADVQRALAHDEFIAFYQPKVELASGKLVGFEALARWKHPTKGLLPPSAFKVAFEESELSTGIDRAMLANIVSDMQAWHAIGLKPGRVSLNLSSFDFADDDVAATILGQLADAGIGCDEFEIEVTETVLLDNRNERVAKTLQVLHEAGIKISLDDCGTGFSSLTHLKNFTVDELKIDKSFISNVASDDGDAAIVGGLIGLAAALGLTVVAEGIETQAQLDRLVSMGCGFGQGYLFAKPMAASRLPWFVTEARDRHSVLGAEKLKRRR